MSELSPSPQAVPSPLPSLLPLAPPFISVSSSSSPHMVPSRPLVSLLAWLARRERTGWKHESERKRPANSAPALGIWECEFSESVSTLTPLGLRQTAHSWLPYFSAFCLEKVTLKNIISSEFMDCNKNCAKYKNLCAS